MTSYITTRVENGWLIERCDSSEKWIADTFDDIAAVLRNDSMLNPPSMLTPKPPYPTLRVGCDD